jgi:hypothetical protein
LLEAPISSAAPRLIRLSPPAPVRNATRELESDIGRQCIYCDGQYRAVEPEEWLHCESCRRRHEYKRG